LRKHLPVLSNTLKNSTSNTPGVIWAVVTVLSALFFSKAVFADRMGSTNYELLFTNINMGGRTTSSSNYTLDMSLGQTAAKRWEEYGYIVRAGFQYVHILYPFTFKLSDTTLDFGTLIPSAPSTKSLTLTISNRGQGYQVMVYADGKLETFDGLAWIENTNCDGPSYCSTTTAAQWLSNSVYGYGYNVTGHDVSADFNSSADYYRQFSTSPIVFMESSQAGVDRQSVFKVKINIDNTQQAGTYQNILRFIAVPKY